MKLEEQVLNREQVQELIELGFDVRKYATSAVIEAKDGNHYIVDRRLLSINMGFMETEVIEYFETLSIGDIMEILPEQINDRELNLNPIHGCAFITYGNYKEDGYYLFSDRHDNFIDALFETLKFCIKDKHI